MQELNLTDNPSIPKDKEQRQPDIQYWRFKENVQALLEVEVTESLHATMFSKNEHFIDQSGVIDITIIRPGIADSVMNPPQNSVTLSTIKGNVGKSSEFQYCARPYRRPATNAMNRCRIPHLDRRQNKNFFTENQTESPAPMNVGEIVGDLPSKVAMKSRIVLPENNVKLRHGDHCNSFISDPEIPNAELNQQTVAVELLKSYINFCNSASKMDDELPCINPLVYQVHLEEKTTRESHPLVEFDVAQKILEDHELGESAQCKTKRQIIEAMRRTLTEWGSDEKRITDILYNDTAPLMRCKHCGVISFQEAQILVPTVRENLSANVDKTHQVRCGDDKKCLTNSNTENFYDLSALSTYDDMSRTRLPENTSQSKSSTSFTENEDTKDKLRVQKPGVKKGLENSSEVKFHGLWKPETKLLPVNTMTAERDIIRDFISENKIKMITVGQKKELKTVPPSAKTNNCGNHSSVTKDGKSDDTRFKNSYSSRYSSRQIAAKAVENLARDTCPGNRNRNSFETSSNRTKFQTTNFTPLSKAYEKARAPSRKNNSTDSNNFHNIPMGAGNNATSKSLRNNKLSRSQIARFNIPTIIERTSSIKPLSPKNVTNYLVREKRSAIDEEERTPLQIDGKPSIRRTGKQSFVLSENQTLLAEGIRGYSQDQCADLNSLTKNLLSQCVAFSNDKLSTDQECSPGNNHLTNSDDDQRSSRTKNRKCDQSHPDYNYSAPLIGLSRETFGNKDFAFDRCLAGDNLHAQYHEESETTAFSSSSSENVIREWSNPFVPGPRFDCESLDLNSNKSSADAIPSIRAQIDKAIEKCSNYDAGISEEKLHSHETLRELDNSLKLNQNNVISHVDCIAKELERLKSSDNKMTVERFETRDDSKKVLPANDTTKITTGFVESTFKALDNDTKLEGALDIYRVDDNHDVHMVKEARTKESQNNVSAIEHFGEIRSEQSEIPEYQLENFDTPNSIFPNKQECMGSKALDKSSKNFVKITYKNPTSVISSSSEYSNEYHQELDVQQSSLCNGEDESVLQLYESETFERQITYDGTSSKDISTGSKRNPEAKASPIYRKILESEDEMDWETFQQLVGILHPSQKELWYDICNAVSNEAKRVAGETGASTEVCIEINPIPINQSFSCETKISRVETSSNEISFEMDMILTDSETFLDQESRSGLQTGHEFEKCQ